MVKVSQTFVIDTTFILKQTAEAFQGAPLLAVAGKDLTFLYGFARDLLRLRRTLGVGQGILVVGREGHDAAIGIDVEGVVEFARDLGFPVVNERRRSVLDLCYHLSQIATHLVTNDAKLVQLTTNALSILWPKPANEYECLTPKEVLSVFGIRPVQIPTLLALHHSVGARQKAGPLTRGQAIRLTELYGDLENINANLDAIKAAGIREKLTASREDIRRTYQASRIDTRPLSVGLDFGRMDWRIDNEHTAKILHAHRFYSLVRLLSLPEDVPLIAPAPSRESNTYKVVQDREALQRLEAEVCGAEVCALDAESDDKDPRKASLLGVAFSVTKGAAVFVPLIERDLKRVSREEVLASIQRVLNRQQRIVGHNMKYDALLLRRHGLMIRNIYFDTMLAAYDCFGDWDFFNLGFLTEKLLGSRIKRYADVVRTGQTFLDMPLREMACHGCQDADYTLRLYGCLDKELERRGIRAQYNSSSMNLLRHLADYEFQGVEVDLEELERKRSDVLAAVGVSKNQAWEKLGMKVDLDSEKELAAALSELLGSAKRIGPKGPTSRVLEELAVVYPDVRPVVEYKRLCKKLRLVEAVAASVRGGRVHPLFNQVSSASGCLCSSDPDLFGGCGLHSVNACISGTLRALFPDRGRALELLEAETNDCLLRADRREQGSRNAFMAKHAKMNRLEHDEFLLSVVCGESGPAMSRRFLLERADVESACHDLRVRYNRVFEWASAVRDGAMKRGFVTGLKGRKYLAGLSSSSVEKRKNAADACVCWLIGL